jgi:hypothetical protein
MTSSAAGRASSSRSLNSRCSIRFHVEALTIECMGEFLDHQHERLTDTPADYLCQQVGLGPLRSADLLTS